MLHVQVPPPSERHDGPGTLGTWYQRSQARARVVLPGAVVAAAISAVALVVHDHIPDVSPYVVALVLGIALANVGGVPTAANEGARVAQRRLLRLGVVLLGFQVSVSEVASIGVAGLVAVTVIVVATFLVTRRLARALGLSEQLAVMLGAGFAICGASAVAAMDEITDASDEEVTFAIALVTICGTVAVIVLPILAGPFGLSSREFGTWVGASVHDVAQVVAAAGQHGVTALHSAIVVKLTRVALLVPLVAVVGRTAGWRTRRAADADADAAATVDGAPRKRGTPPLPVFMVGFLAAVAVASTGVFTASQLAFLKELQTLCFTAALAALGMHVRVSRLRGIGWAGVAVGAIASVGIAVLGVVAALVVFSPR
jgi:uncharacterized integral membrane protein (TIGR00698 family)